MQADQREFRDGVPFLGGRLWIDLLNTTPLGLGAAVDFLADAEAQQRWAALAGVSTAQVTDPARILALRSALRPAFETMAQGAALPKAALVAINEVLGQVTVGLELAAQDGALHLIQRETLPSDPLAAAVALDFARFAQNYEPERLRHCANPACNMVFHDQGRNNRRRWCSMAACGNRDKVANFRARRAEA